MLSLPVAILVAIVSCCSIARRTFAIVVVTSRAVAIIVARCAFAIIVDNGKTSVHWRMKVAVNGMFFWLAGVGGDG